MQQELSESSRLLAGLMDPAARARADAAPAVRQRNRLRRISRVEQGEDYVCALPDTAGIDLFVMQRTVALTSCRPHAVASLSPSIRRQSLRITPMFQPVPCTALEAELGTGAQGPVPPK